MSVFVWYLTMNGKHNLGVVFYIFIYLCIQFLRIQIVVQLISGSEQEWNNAEIPNGLCCPALGLDALSFSFEEFSLKMPFANENGLALSKAVFQLGFFFCCHAQSYRDWRWWYSFVHSHLDLYSATFV